MPGDFSAFIATTVLDGIHPRIEALEVWQDWLLIGLSDGCLVVAVSGQLASAPAQPAGAAQPSHPAQGQTTTPCWQVVQTHKGFAKRGVSQLQAASGSNLLLSLNEEGVRAHALPDLALCAALPRTRGAQRFAWNQEQAILAVAVKRRLLVFHYNTTEFVELKELSLPEPATALAWAGHCVCLGFKKEYGCVNIDTGAFTELCSTGRPGGAVLAALGGGEVLLGRDNVALLLGQDGKLSRKTGITWSDTPVALAFSRPYAVALLPNYIEVRSTQRLSAHGLAQLLPIRDMTIATPLPAPDGSLFVASANGGSLQRLVPVPVAEQAAALAELGEFQEALALAALLPASQAGERARLEGALHLRYGHSLFAGGEYEAAMAQWGMARTASPLTLLRLFPALAPPALLAPVQDLLEGAPTQAVGELDAAASQRAVAALLPYLLSHRSRLAAGESQDDSEEGSVERQGAGEAGATPRLTPAQRSHLAALVDTAILKAMLVMSDSGALLRFVARPNSVDLGEGEAALREAGRYSELVALWQARGQHRAALGLLRTLSCAPADLAVPPQGAAAELAGVTGAWAAVRYLVAVGPSELDLIKAHAKWILQADPEAGLSMFTEMRPPLAPSTVLPLLAAHMPALCAPYLEAMLAAGVADPAQYHTQLALLYLRQALHQLPSPSSPRRAKDEQVAASNSRSASSSTGQPAGPTLPLPDPPEPLQRLQDLILSSPHVAASQLLAALPAGALGEVRALLLERLGRHADALRLYVHDLRNTRLAEAYCDRVYAAQSSAAGPSPSTSGAGGEAGNATGHASEIYLSLIEVYLERDRHTNLSSSGDQTGVSHNTADISLSTWEEVALLLSRKHGRIDLAYAMNLLPAEVPLKAVLPFLEGALRGVGEQQRNLAVIKSLRRAENLQVREELIQWRQRSFVVSLERACGICHKRLAGAAFVGYPDGVLVHYSCYKRCMGSSDTARGSIGLAASAQ